MANPSRDWRQDRSRDQRHSQFYRDHDERPRDYRSDFERDDERAYGRSTEGIGDYGGYGSGSRGAYSEEERSYRSDFSPLSGRRYGHPDRDEGRDSVQERYGNPPRTRGAYGYDSGADRDRDAPSSFAYGRNEYGGDPRQSHRGKGPKGYQRSDERLKEVICERLSDDPHIDASEITLSVSGGNVKLTGLVDSRRDKFEVEELIAQCGGVNDVDNQLRVQSGFARGRDLSLSANGGYAASALDGSSPSGSRRPEATSTTSGLSSPAKKQ